MKHDETITLDGDGGWKNTDHIWLVVEPNPSEKSWSDFVSWDGDIPNMMGKYGKVKKIMVTFPTEWKIIKFHGSKSPTSNFRDDGDGHNNTLQM